MRRLLYFAECYFLELVIILYLKSVYPDANSFECLNYLFFYDPTNSISLQISKNLLPYIGLIGVYTICLFYIIKSSFSFKKDYIGFVLTRLQSRRKFSLWNLKLIMLNTIEISIILTISLYLSFLTTFDISILNSEQLWLFLVNFVFVFSSIGFSAVHINLRTNDFVATAFSLFIVVVIFSIIIGIQKVNIITFSKVINMERGILISIIVYFLTIVLVSNATKKVDF